MEGNIKEEEDEESEWSALNEELRIDENANKVACLKVLTRSLCHWARSINHGPDGGGGVRLPPCERWPRVTTRICLRHCAP